MDSILTTIKKLLGITEEYTHFDHDIIIAINSVFMILNQLGVGPTSCYAISGDTEEWTDFTEDIETINLVKTYIYMKVKLIFDPPTSSILKSALDEQIKEYEWRLNVAVDPERTIP